MWFATRNVMRCRTMWSQHSYVEASPHGRRPHIPQSGTLNEVFTLRPKGASHLKFLYFCKNF